MGQNILVPMLRYLLALTPGRIRIRREANYQFLEETAEAIKIMSNLAQDQIKHAIIVYDNFVSPPTYGDYIYVVMAGRYFLRKKIKTSLFIVDGEYRYDWESLSNHQKNFHVGYLVEIAKTLLTGGDSSIEVLTFDELNAKLDRIYLDGCFLYFEDRVKRRSEFYVSTFKILNRIMSSADDDLRESFLISSHEIRELVPFGRPSLPYITWHCRYSEKWGESRNTDDNKFVAIYHRLKHLYPDHLIMIISDQLGCDHFKELARRKSLDCVFSKDYSQSFMGDAGLVLESDYYYQYRGGGMNAIAFFGKIPYEIHASADTIEWKPGKVGSWSSDDQIFLNIPLADSSYLPEGSVPDHQFLPQKIY